ncbi:uncharacterized protein LOC107031034 [Solanum pennellii]|uniref:Uncharacterized protein LOC107031034 n=1 Tax=Solanum pennellii TaxID=28526 RepID=A0ABM1HMK5_SOLPN|nr:uncharacterized protein LOC107031034 [Solanum pennellii]
MLSPPPPPPPPPQSPLPCQYGGSSSESDCPQRQSSSESDYPSSLKKQKVDEEDGESSDCESEQPLSYSLSDTSENDLDIQEAIEELYCPVGPGEKKADKAVWDRYFDQIRESEGFDIKDYPGSCPLTSIYPMTNYLDTPANVEMLKDYCAKALEHYNTDNGTKYEVDRIVKVNEGGCQGFVYYITFTVKNGDSEYFQAKVVEHINKNKPLEFPIVRPRVKGGLDI